MLTVRNNEKRTLKIICSVIKARGFLPATASPQFESYVYLSGQKSIAFYYIVMDVK